MARTHFQKFGSWFPRAGRTMVISGICAEDAETPEMVSLTPYYLFAMPFLSGGEGQVEAYNEGNTWPSDGQRNLVATRLEDDAPMLVISDIPEGVIFYLTDNGNGDVPSADDEGNVAGCFITWTD